MLGGSTAVKRKNLDSAKIQQLFLIHALLHDYFAFYSAFYA